MADHRPREKTRLRAAKACHRCNVKRIKCDATQGIPCSRCRQSGNVDCVLRQSRRGTYVRKSRNATDMLASDEQMQQSDSNDEQESGAQNEEREEEDQTSSAAQQMDASGNLEDRQSPIPRATATIAMPAGQYQPETRENGISRQSVTTGSSTTPQTSGDFLSPSTSRISVASSSYREMPWSAMFDHFLNMRQDRSRREFIDKASITYLGESFPLAIILDDFREGGMPKLHHPAPPYPGSSVSHPHPHLHHPDNQDQSQDQDTSPGDHSHPPHVPTQELEYLQGKGAFEYPEKAQWDEFMKIFLDRVFPAYPIFNLNELVHQYRNDALPPILIHAICFLSATFCPIIILHRAGWTSRREARFAYYQKAKALFDAQ